ncbi:MAG: DUF1501 domain-containing protein [Pseudomonadota bacterium]
MKRRDFLRLSATASGMMLCGGVRLAQAQQAFSGAHWLLIEANGGWDPTSFCDPKGFGLGVNGDINNYDQADIGQAGNIRFAPPPDSFASSSLFSNADFFNAHFERLVVVNGINHGTNSHTVGRTASWTGTRVREYPSIGPMVAWGNNPELSLPFVASQSRESSKTLGIVPRALLSNGNQNAIREIASPNLVNTNRSDQYHSNSARALIDAAANARRARQLANQRLARLQNALGEHNAARNRDVNTLRSFVTELDNVAAPNSYVQSRTQARSLFNQAQTAFAGFESGAAATAQIGIGGFDTHDDHDARHYPRLMDYLAGVDNIISDAQARGIADNLIIVMGSDFGRTNKYNNDNGKDHWSHTSMMVWAGPAIMAGNRVVGATDDLQRSRRINPTTLEVNDSGIELSPEYTHQALRRLAGIDQDPQVTSAFPLSVSSLPIFA